MFILIVLSHFKFFLPCFFHLIQIRLFYASYLIPGCFIVFILSDFKLHDVILTFSDLNKHRWTCNYLTYHWTCLSSFFSIIFTTLTNAASNKRTLLNTRWQQHRHLTPFHTLLHFLFLTILLLFFVCFCIPVVGQSRECYTLPRAATQWHTGIRSTVNALGETWQ